MDAITPTTTATVEEVVRGQLAKALGGRRGMLEAAVPTAVFTVLFLTTHALRTSVLVAVGCAVVLLVVRLVQRTTPQFVVNSLFGIGIGALFAWRAARGGGDANDQALAYFLPGILYNLGYSVLMVLTIVVRWPLVGFMVGSVTGDPTGWRADRATVRLCSRLTWLLVLPCVIRVAGAGPGLPGGPQRLVGPGLCRGRPGRREARHGVAAAARRPGRHGVAAQPQQDAGGGLGSAQDRPDLGDQRIGCSGWYGRAAVMSMSGRADEVENPGSVGPGVERRRPPRQVLGVVARFAQPDAVGRARRPAVTVRPDVVGVADRGVAVRSRARLVDAASGSAGAGPRRVAGVSPSRPAHLTSGGCTADGSTQSRHRGPGHGPAGRGSARDRRSGLARRTCRAAPCRSSRSGPRPVCRRA